MSMQLHYWCSWFWRAPLNSMDSRYGRPATGWGRPGVIVTINTLAMLIYGGLFFGLTSRFGLLAPGLASVAAALISLISLSIAVLQMSRTRP